MENRRKTGPQCGLAALGSRHLHDGAQDVLAEAWFDGRVTDETVENAKRWRIVFRMTCVTRARRSLAILTATQADQVVNPINCRRAGGTAGCDAQRFMCPKCGGRMSFEPQGQSLLCDYCTRDHALAVGLSNDEKDFIIAMATMKGHGRPLQDQVFHCSGCGAEFILPPGQISANCVYCNSPHVVSLERSKDLLAPMRSSRMRLTINTS